MRALRQFIKSIFYRTGTVVVYDRLHFLISLLRYAGKNRVFKKEHPDFALPPDYYLYETYKPDYRKYKEDGELTAGEFLEWAQPFVPQPKHILEWGCGVARIVRHLPGKVAADAEITGADISKPMIEWNAAHIPGVRFVKTDYYPPLPFADQSFDMVYALSVFTHIEYRLQQDWLREIQRVLRAGGVFLFTTHGRKYHHALSEAELKELREKGGATKSYQQKGHRMMGTYNSCEAFKAMLPSGLELLAYYDGVEHPEKVGGQDLWIVRRKAADE